MFKSAAEKVFSIPELSALIAGFSDADVAAALSGLGRKSQPMVNIIKQYYQRHTDLFAQEHINEEERAQLCNFILEEMKRKRRINGVVSHSPRTKEFVRARLEEIFAGCEKNPKQLIVIAVAVIGDSFSCNSEGDFIFIRQDNSQRARLYRCYICLYDTAPEEVYVAVGRAQLTLKIDSGYLDSIKKDLRNPENLYPVVRQGMVADLLHKAVVTKTEIRDSERSTSSAIAQYILGTELVTIKNLPFIRITAAFADASGTK